MPPNIWAIGISSFPLRIYVSTKKTVQVFTVKPNAKGTCILQGVQNIEKIRFQQGLLILCSKTSVTGFRFQEEKKTWNPEFLINGNPILKEVKRWFPRCGIDGNTILDALLVHETKLLVLSVKKQVLGWQIYDYKELAAAYLGARSFNDELERPPGSWVANNAITFQPRYHWSAAENGLPLADVLDTSSEGLCLISSDESDIWVLDLIKEDDSPASGWAGNGGENNCGGYGCFLRSCGIDGHQAPFIFCGTKYLEWAVCQKHQNQTINLTMEERIKELEDNRDKDWEIGLAAAKQPAPGDHLMEKYEDISGWQSDEIDRNEDYPVFPFCYHYCSGIAFVWNSEESSFLGATVSAVILLDYTEQEGNCRLYERSDYIDGYYNL